MNFTKEQEQAIFARNQDILVSAGAGAGKTRVLVTRISEMILDSQNPVSADEVLVLTFTKAAAREMKERIAKELERRLDKDPENSRLRKQIRVVKHADISTVHSFCNHLIRTHFNELGIDPSYRIGEEGELKILKQEAMDDLLEERYSKGEESFLRFVESYASGKDDKSIEQMIFDLYDFSKSFPDSQGWFAQTDKEFVKMCSEEGMERSKAFQIILKQIRQGMEQLRSFVDRGLAYFIKDPGPDRYYALLMEDKKRVDQLLQAKTYVELYEVMHSIHFDRMISPRKDEKTWPYLDEVKEIHTSIKNTIEELKKKHFLKSLSQIRIEQKSLYPLFQEFISLGQEFQKRYADKKKDKNIYDYDDLEQYTLKLLVETYDENHKAVPSMQAREIAGKYKAIFVDEYQDTNLVQEMIITTLLEAGEGELFVVGDVKQSIYRFRQARPDLFLYRYERYKAGEGLKIELRDNFRSSPDVLEFCNQVFRRFMTVDFGGIDYNEEVALVAGENGPMKEVHEKQEALLLLEDEAAQDQQQYDPYLMESMMIAERIDSLLKEGYCYKDMVILLRSVKEYGQILAEGLEQKGIPVLLESQTGYFKSREIRVILNYLSVIDNVYQDIPMACAMLSGIGGFTPSDLAAIKIIVEPSLRGKTSLYDLMHLYLTEGTDMVRKDKIHHFLSQLEEFREKKEEMLLHELLWEIYEKTGFYDEVLSMPQGDRRRDNLMMLMKKSMEYEKTSFKGLFYFIRFMDQMRTYEVEPGGGSIIEAEENAVKIMTIHKSKGLEFPLVFVSTLSKGFNLMDLNNSVLYHPELGIGMERIDLEHRTKTPSLLKMAIREQLRKEILEEELRILYVAMTRAQKKVILTGIVKEKQLEDLEETNGAYIQAENAKCFMDWILPVVYKEGKWEHCRLYEVQEIFDLLKKEEEKAEAITLQEMLMDERVMQADPTVVYNAFSRKYPFEEEIGWKRKQSISELKKLNMLDIPGEESLFAQDLEKENEVPIPLFLQKQVDEVSGTLFGTMVHKIMELLPFGKISSKKELFDEIQPLFDLYPEINENQRKKIYLGVEAFLFHEHGQRIRQMDLKGKLYKELPFTVGLDSKHVHPDSAGEEYIVVQGIVDLCGEEEDGLWLVDYKTDSIREGKESILLDRYKFQMLYYKLALEKILKKPVHTTLIYSFALKKFIPVTWD